MSNMNTLRKWYDKIPTEAKILILTGIGNIMGILYAYTNGQEISWKDLLRAVIVMGTNLLAWYILQLKK